MNSEELRAFLETWLPQKGFCLDGLAYVPVQDRQDHIHETVVRFLTKYGDRQLNKAQVVSLMNRISANAASTLLRSQPPDGLGRRVSEETLPDDRKREEDYIAEEQERAAASRNSHTLLACLIRWFPGEDARYVGIRLKSGDWKGDKQFRTYRGRFIKRVRERLPEDLLRLLGSLLLKPWNFVAPQLVNPDPFLNWRAQGEYLRMRRVIHLYTFYDEWVAEVLEGKEWNPSDPADRRIADRFMALDDTPIVLANGAFDEASRRLDIGLEMSVPARRRQAMIGHRVQNYSCPCRHGWSPSDRRLWRQLERDVVLHANPHIWLAAALVAYRRAAERAIEARDRRLFQLSHSLSRFCVGRLEPIPKKDAVEAKKFLHEDISDPQGAINWLSANQFLDLQVAADTSLWHVEGFFARKQHDEALSFLETFRSQMSQASGIQIPMAESVEEILQLD